MPCPKCGSHNLWEDCMANGAWGCNSCDWMNIGGTVYNKTSTADRFDGYRDNYKDQEDNDDDVAD